MATQLDMRTYLEDNTNAKTTEMSMIVEYTRYRIPQERRAAFVGAYEQAAG